jgi:heme/copper-type cytochrome/quinol oxidase subunit 3
MERSEQQTNVETKFKIIIAYYINVKSTFFPVYFLYYLYCTVRANNNATSR